MLGLRLADVLFGEDSLPAEEILALIEWLPDTSAFAACQAAEAAKADAEAEARGEEVEDPPTPQWHPKRFYGWGWDRMIAARVVDESQMSRINALAIHTDRKHKSSLPKFTPFPSPWAVEAKKDDASPQQRGLSAARKFLAKAASDARKG
ncbi:hypothetical protein GCM10027298_22520 [Epidermidibacterium keratini]